MALSACKVPINCRLQAAIDAFHRLREMPRWRKLRQEQRDAYNELAIKVDERTIEGYDEVNGKIAAALDSLPEDE